MPVSSDWLRVSDGWHWRKRGRDEGSREFWAAWPRVGAPARKVIVTLSPKSDGLAFGKYQSPYQAE